MRVFVQHEDGPYLAGLVPYHAGMPCLHALREPAPVGEAMSAATSAAMIAANLPTMPEPPMRPPVRLAPPPQTGWSERAVSVY